MVLEAARMRVFDDNALRARASRLGRSSGARLLIALLDLGASWKRRLKSLPMMTTNAQQFFVLEVELDQFAGALDPVLAKKVK